MRSAWVLAGLLVSLLVVPAARADHVDDGEIKEVLPKDAIPAITDPTFTKEHDLADDERVMGVEIRGDARAYPLKILNWHEIVDDVVGGEPLAVSYCPLCRTGLVFDRTVQGETLTFKVSGKLLRNNLVMYDTKTESLWPQAWGEAIEGSFHGTELELVSSQTTTFGTWRKAHPDTLVMETPDYDRDYDRDPYAGYEDSRQTLEPTRYDVPDLLHPKALVIGLETDQGDIAWSYELVRNERVVDADEHGVVLTFAGESVQAFRAQGRTFQPAGNGTMVDASGQRYDRFSGEALDGGSDLVQVPADTPFWFSWFEFHPRTGLWHTDGFHSFGEPSASEGGDGFPWLGVLFPLSIVAAVGVGVWLHRTEPE